LRTNWVMKIEIAGPQDIPALVQLVNSAYRGEGSKKGWTTEADLLDGTRTDDINIAEMMREKDAVFLKGINEQSDILATVYLQQQGNNLYLGMLTVSPDLQAGGIGKGLLRASDEYALEHKCTRIYMTVISVRDELIAWYQRHGYARTGEKKAFPVGEKFGIQKQPLELAILEKKL
jgi:ribosomal protein S18 acetylase RimI-like enzyme